MNGHPEVPTLASSQIAFHPLRHLGLLGSMAAVLAIAGPPRAAIAAQFALYGALHAAALAVSVGGGPSCGRRILFVAAAAALAMLAARLALYGLSAAGALAVFVSSALGALAYGVSICSLLGMRPGRARLGLGTLAAASAASAAFIVCRRLGTPSALWPAIAWWFAYSASLWPRFA